MELNREQIIKALECCTKPNCVGFECPLYGDQAACVTGLNIAALSLIKELTRKLECANLEIECKEHICESYAFQYGTVVDKNFWLKKEREATIQKYREALYRAFAHSDSKDKFNKKVFLEAVDRTAEEIIGGTK